MSDLSDFLTSVARFFVKIYFHKKCGVFEACKKVTDFFDTLQKSHRRPVGFLMLIMLKLLCAVLAVVQLLAEQLGIVCYAVAVVVVLDSCRDCFLGEYRAVDLVRGQTVESLNNSLV